MSISDEDAQKLTETGPYKVRFVLKMVAESGEEWVWTGIPTEERGVEATIDKLRDFVTTTHRNLCEQGRLPRPTITED